MASDLSVGHVIMGLLLGVVRGPVRGVGGAAGAFPKFACVFTRIS